MGSTFAPPSIVSDPAYVPSSGGPSNEQLYKSYCAVNGVDPAAWAMTQTNGTLPIQVPVASLEEKCLNSFFHHFHASHPFVLPKPFLIQISKDGSTKPLLAAIRWVGSIFLDIAVQTRDQLFNEAFALIYDPQRLKDGFLAQAMMLLIVGLDGSCQQEKARGILGDVETLALELGLNTREFATNNGRGIAVLEESWRRTWWDLFIIDGMVAGVHRATNFLLFDVPAGVALPCEEDQYLNAVSDESGGE